MLIYHVEPVAISHGPSAGLQRIDSVFFEPFVDIEKEILLGPQHSGQPLPQNQSLILARTFRSDGFIEVIGLSQTALKGRIETLKGVADGMWRQIG